MLPMTLVGFVPEGHLYLMLSWCALTAFVLGPEWVELKWAQSFLQVFTAMEAGMWGMWGHGAEEVCPEVPGQTHVCACQHTHILINI